MVSPPRRNKVVLAARSRLRRGTNWVYRNLFFLIALVIGPSVLFFVPQVFNVWYSEQPPAEEFNTGWYWLWWTFALFFGGGAFFFLASVYLVPRTYTRREKAAAPKRVSMKGAKHFVFHLFDLACYVVDHAVTFPAAAIERMPGRWPRLIVGLATGAVAIAVLWFGPAVDYGWPYSLAGAFYRNAAWWLLCVGGWIAACGILLVRDEPLRGNADRPVLVLVGRFLAWIAVTYIAAEIIWAGANLPPTSQIFTLRAYTLWMILHVWGVATVLAACLDYADSHIRLLPIRILAFVVIVAVFLVSRPPANSDVFHVADVPSAPPAADGLSQLEARLRGIPENEPVVFVAASGGGSRAAIFTSLVYEFLARRPLATSAGQVATNPDTKKPRTWADNIVLISAVSGGSLATAHFVDREVQPSAMRERTENAILDELIARFESNVKMLASQEPEAVEDQATFEKARDRALKLLESARQTPASSASSTAAVDAWILRSAFVDDMGMNFMAPIVRGATTTNLPRGQALGRFWDDKFGWTNSDNLHGFAPPHGDALAASIIPLVATNRPLVVFNACDVSRGSRIAIGFPPLPADMFAVAAKETTRSAPVELAHLYEGETVGVTLSKAVRLSSNFPWAFHPTVVEPLNPRPTDTRTLILDGGIADNTGVDTIFELMRGLSATSHPAGKSILRLLRRRQVVFLEIDSGSKPSPPTSLDRVFAVLLEPIQALNNAGYTNADHTRQQYVQAVGEFLSLRRDFESDLLTADQREALRAVPANITPITVRCNHFSLQHPDRNSVMTAWALGPNDKANVLARFAFELGRLEDALASVERVGPDFLTAKQSLYQLFPEQAAEILVAEIESGQQFANSLTEKLAQANPAQLSAAEQTQIAAAIRPYQETAEQIAIVANQVQQSSNDLDSKLSGDRLKLWSHAWQHNVQSKLPKARPDVKPLPGDMKLSNDWAQAVSGPNRGESPQATARAIEELKSAGRNLESSRRTVQRSNEGSKQWFTEEKGHRSKSRYQHETVDKRRPEDVPPR